MRVLISIKENINLFFWLWRRGNNRVQRRRETSYSRAPSQKDERGEKNETKRFLPPTSFHPVAEISTYVRYEHSPSSSSGPLWFVGRCKSSTMYILYSYSLTRSPARDIFKSGGDPDPCIASRPPRSSSVSLGRLRIFTTLPLRALKFQYRNPNSHFIKRPFFFTINRASLLFYHTAHRRRRCRRDSNYFISDRSAGRNSCVCRVVVIKINIKITQH